MCPPGKCLNQTRKYQYCNIANCKFIKHMMYFIPSKYTK